MVEHDLRRDILAATMRCLARWGLSKTTLDDIAREAGCSRATVYRLFPGGKDNLLRHLVADEVAHFFSSIADRLDSAADIEDLLVEGLTEALRQLREHPALGFLLEHEPTTVLPHPASGAMAHMVASAGAFVEPHLTRWLEPPHAQRVADWTVRMALSYATVPPESPPPDDQFGVRALVEELLAPAVRRLATPAPSTP
ncbi:MAG: TetR/AcrR family transcriptional regulator [Acidimicrobiales bacterium]|nr:TetR/AcrR family transcriptional regulator [Acidimicrobiales bacterium]